MKKVNKGYLKAYFADSVTYFRSNDLKDFFNPLTEQPGTILISQLNKRLP